MLAPEGMGQFMAHSTTHPKYLHSNSTSHVWAFGAIAELVDNALDAGATKFHIDLLTTSQLFAVKPEPGRRSSSARKPDPFVMTFRDDGKGMTPLELHKMLSFGHCDKDQHASVNGQVMPIGHYGNGFKSGSMRLGKDALVFTKSTKTQSVGLLSQTFLKETNATEVFVPIVSWDNDTGEAISVGYSGKSLNITPINTSPQLTEAFKANVKVINKYSPYESTAALRVALDKIQGTGTHVVVYNLRKPEQADDPCEFSLEDNSERGFKHDIQLAKCMWDEVTVAAGHSLAPLYYSLREYTSILYLNPRMQIWIRGHKVQLRKLEHCLYKPRECIYKSKADGMSEPVTVTLGFNKISEKEHFGMMIYHRDRLIKCFLHVGYQLSPDSRGVGVIGVLNVNALQPTHNKQSFIMDNNYRLLVNNLKDQLAKYWSTVTSKGTLTEFWSKLARAKSRGKTCIQCTKCMKWRSVKIRQDKIPELWECKMLESGYSCSMPQRLPKIEKLIKRSAATDLGDVEKKLEEQVIKIEKRHKDTLIKLRAVKAKELATTTGFPVEKCAAALRVSADNKEIAGELLFSNKPIPGFDFEMEELDDDEEEEQEEQEAEEVEVGSDEAPLRRKRKASAKVARSSKRRRKNSLRTSSSTKRSSRSTGGNDSDNDDDDNDDNYEGSATEFRFLAAGDSSGAMLTERERRLLERQKHKQRMLEERMLGHDAVVGRNKGKEKEDQEEEEEESTTTTTTATSTTRHTARRNGPRADEEEDNGNDEDYDDEEEGDEGEETEVQPASQRLPYGAASHCERCVTAEDELRRKNDELRRKDDELRQKDDELAALRQRVRELESLQLQLQTQQQQSPLVQQPKLEPPQETTAPAEVVHHPYILIKDDPDPEPAYEFIEFL